MCDDASGVPVSAPVETQVSIAADIGAVASADLPISAAVPPMIETAPPVAPSTDAPASVTVDILPAATPVSVRVALPSIVEVEDDPPPASPVLVAAVSIADSPAPAPAPPIIVKADAPIAGAQSTEYQIILREILADLLSCASVSGADLFRYIPRLAAQIQKLDLPNADKCALVIAGGHELVDRRVPEADRADAHRLVDAVFPAAIAGVIDLARGRVEFPRVAEAVAVAAAPVVAEVAQSCLPRFLAWFRGLRR